MINTVIGFFGRRRRFFLLKLLAAVCFLMTLLIWSKSNHGKVDDLENGLDSGDLIHTEKLIGKGPHKVDSFKPPLSNSLLESESRVNKVVKVTRKHTGIFDSQKDSILRESVLAENTDEFLEPVLREVKYVEVDLSKHRGDFNDYDAEIEDDMKRVKPGLGDKGDKATVPSYQKQVADSIMKKEAFNRLLSEMISVNRSVPDTRESM